MRYALKKHAEESLRRTGLPWSIENGKKHNKVFLAGRMIGVLPHGIHGQARLSPGFLRDIEKRVLEVNGQAK